MTPLGSNIFSWSRVNKRLILFTAFYLLLQQGSRLYNLQTVTFSHNEIRPHQSNITD
jgi:hypothetical protein